MPPSPRARLLALRRAERVGARDGGGELRRQLGVPLRETRRLLAELLVERLDRLSDALRLATVLGAELLLRREQRLHLARRALVPVARVGELRAERVELRAVLLAAQSRSSAAWCFVVASSDSPSRTAARGRRSRPAASPLLAHRARLLLEPPHLPLQPLGARRRRRRLRHRVLRRFPRQRLLRSQLRVEGVAFALRRREPPRQLLHRPRPVDVRAPAVRRAAARHGERRAEGEAGRGSSFSRSREPREAVVEVGGVVVRLAELVLKLRDARRAVALHLRAVLLGARARRAPARATSPRSPSAPPAATPRAPSRARAPPPPRRAATARAGGSRRTHARAPRRR